MSLKSCKEILPFHNDLKIPSPDFHMGTPLPLGLTNTEPLSTVTLTSTQLLLYSLTGPTPSDYFRYPTPVMNVKPILLHPPLLSNSLYYPTSHMTLTTVAPKNIVIT